MKFLHEKPLHYDVKEDVGNQLDTIQTYVDELKEQLQLIQNDPLITPNNLRILEARDQLNFFLIREERYKKLVHHDIGGYFYVPAEASREDLKNFMKSLTELPFQQNPPLSNIIESLTTKIELPPEKSRQMEITIPLLQCEAWLVQSLLSTKNTILRDMQSYLKNYEYLIVPMNNIDRTQLSEKEDNLIQDLIRNFQGGFLKHYNANTDTQPPEVEFLKAIKKSVHEILKKYGLQKVDDISSFTENNSSRPVSIIEKVKKFLTQIFEHFFSSQKTTKNKSQKDSFKILKETYHSLKNPLHNEIENDENTPPNPQGK